MVCDLYHSSTQRLMNTFTDIKFEISISLPAAG